jgi:hypothetical protein
VVDNLFWCQVNHLVLNKLFGVPSINFGDENIYFGATTILFGGALNGFIRWMGCSRDPGCDSRTRPYWWLKMSSSRRITPPQLFLVLLLHTHPDHWACEVFVNHEAFGLRE